MSHAVPIFFRVALVALELFTAFGAFFGGSQLIADPSGARVGFSVAMLAGGPFSDYLVPGIVLFVGNGLGMLAVALAVALRWRHAVSASLLLGAFLTCWILVQVAVIGVVSYLQPVMFVVGVLILVVAGLARRAAAR